MTAFLIVNTSVFQINLPMITMGRSLDNHVVIQEPTISRVHAQIHQDGEDYVLTDLNSTGGTYLNGTKVKKSVLRSGDSIVLAATPIVFVQNAPQLSDRAQDQTGPLNEPGPDEEPTAPELRLDWRPKE